MDANHALSEWSDEGAAASVLTLALTLFAENRRAAAASRRYQILTRRRNARSVSARKVFEEFFADH
jgi:thioredoxin-like negative regulator of GroEL